MQVMPATGKELKVGDISQLEPNIHAGVKYMRFMIDHYFDKRADGPAQQGALRLCLLQRRPGPDAAACARRRRSAGSIPNKWFNNVEIVAAEKIGRETVTYVRNIYKYYVAYKLAMENLEERRKDREAVKKPT